MKYRIYVIEDDENIRNLICVALENFGYCASGFETAEEALDSLSALLRRGREASFSELFRMLHKRAITCAHSPAFGTGAEATGLSRTAYSAAPARTTPTRYTGSRSA